MPPKLSLQDTSNSDLSASLTENRIERYYFKRILNKEILPGTRLPSNRELAEQWGTSCSTIQRALNKLEAAGLIDRTPRKGTFVRHKANRAFVGILFGPNLTDETASHYRLLNAALIRELDSEFLSCRTYDNLGTPRQEELDAVLAHLRMDQKSFDFRGYICVTSVPDTVPLDELISRETPRAMSDPWQSGNDILFDTRDFGIEIIKRLHALGAKNLCWFSYSKEWTDVAAINDAADACGLSHPEVYKPGLPAGSSIETVAYQDALILLDRCKKKKKLPDAIIIPDDIVARGVVFALLKRGLRVPEDIRLAILGNEGSDIFYSVPVMRYNYPIRAVSAQLADILKRRMAGLSVASTPFVIKGKLSD